MNEKVLIIDDEVNLRKTLAAILRTRGCETHEAADGTEAQELLRTLTPDLVFCDWKMPKVGGEGVLHLMRKDERLCSVPVIIITAFGSSHNAIEAVRLGAYDFITKPFDLQEISLTAERALAHSALNREVAALRAQVARNGVSPTGRLVGSAGPMVDVFKMIGRVAETDSTVLICGESGTGKELVAEAIHSYSQRRAGPFVVVNCAAIPENLLESELFGHERGAFTGAVARRAGRFEAAEGGTVFLDEIAELPPNLQVKLLRVLQEHTFERVGGKETIRGHFRVLAATNRDLDACVREQVFREDLLYRLNVVRINLPPLRERRSDIVLLAEHFLRMYSEKNSFAAVGFSDEAILLLQSYSFPGNVRELENMIERAVLMAHGRVVMPVHLSVRSEDPHTKESNGDLAQLMSLPFHKAIAQLETRLIERALRESDGNKTDASARLQINRRLLYNKMQEHGINDENIETE
jgi:DNA-binding NtrC family response regulator